MAFWSCISTWSIDSMRNFQVQTLLYRYTSLYQLSLLIANVARRVADEGTSVRYSGALIWEDFRIHKTTGLIMALRKVCGRLLSVGQHLNTAGIRYISIVILYLLLRASVVIKHDCWLYHVYCSADRADIHIQNFGAEAKTRPYNIGPKVSG